MRLIVNTNRIIAALVKDSYSRRIILSSPWECITMSWSAQEIEKHRTEITEKSHLTDEEIDYLLAQFKKKLIHLEDWVIQKYMPEAKIIMEQIDPDDTPFIAAALAAEAAIWSDDKHFTRQNVVKVWTTRELVRTYFS